VADRGRTMRSYRVGLLGIALEVRPEQGSAIVFNDCHDWGGEDGRSLHAGQPPVNPDTVKYAINGWIRSHPVYSQMGGDMF